MELLRRRCARAARAGPTGARRRGPPSRKDIVTRTPRATGAGLSAAGWVCALTVALAGLALLAAAAGAGEAEPVGGPSVCVVFSREAAPYRDAFEGLKARLLEKGPHTFHEFVLGATDTGDLMDHIRKADPDLVVTLGTEASKVVVVGVETTPVVFAMVANPVDAGVLARRTYPGQLVAGVTTDVDPAVQFEALKAVLPHARRVAVIYTPQYTAATVATGEAAATRLGLELVRLPVEPYRVEKALEKLGGHGADALWTITDPGVMAPASARRMLVFALKEKLPVIGFSAAMVKAGGLLGFSVNPHTIGRQAGDVVAGILHEGKRPADYHLVYPAPASLVLNATVARQVDVKLPAPLVKRAAHVYGQKED